MFKRFRWWICAVVIGISGGLVMVLIFTEGQKHPPAPVQVGITYEDSLGNETTIQYWIKVTPDKNGNIVVPEIKVPPGAYGYRVYISSGTPGKEEKLQ